MNRHALLPILAALVIPALGGGCTTVSESFAGRDPGQVWTAMRAAALTPEYRDWRLRRNEVWQDPWQPRLEVYRELERSLRQPGAKPRLEQRTYRFQIALEEDPEPTAKFVSRGFGVPMHARAEADHYFADVWRLLHGPEDLQPSQHKAPVEGRLNDPGLETHAPAPGTPPPVDEPRGAPADESATPPVDVEDLLDEPGA